MARRVDDAKKNEIKNAAPAAARQSEELETDKRSIPGDVAPAHTTESLRRNILGLSVMFSGNMLQNRNNTMDAAQIETLRALRETYQMLFSTEQPSQYRP